MRTLSTYISVLFIALIVFAMPSPLASKNTFTVVIDPGHGGGDVGTPHRKCKQDEKTIALNVSLKLGALIEQNFSDVKVVYTRTKDTYPSLPDRTQIAKKAKGDLFISIHVNAAPDKTARGFETYVFGVSGEKGKRDNEQKRLKERMQDERENLDINGKLVNFDTDIDIETKILCQAQREKHNKQSLEFAEMVHSSIINGAKKTYYAKSVNDRGVRPKNLFVLCYSPMPAVLIELGYMSNLEEEKFINSDAIQKNFAQSIYSAFSTYKHNWDKRQLSNQGNITTDVVETNEPEEQKVVFVETPVEPKKEVKTVEPVKVEAPKPEVKAEEPKPEVKAEEPKPEVKTEEPVKPAVKKSSAITYKIQFLLSNQVLPANAKELKGLSPVEYYKEGTYYKYTYGNAVTQAEMQQNLKKVKALFKDAFPVKFDSEGNKIK